jgi:NAD(P)-dependent dehydrogenase (short-subunit alcohol dehydrogenase family)
MAHTAYSAAKFAVKGFTEALINDFRLNAPHVHVSVVMPGHIGTSIVINSGKILGFDPKEMTHDDFQTARDTIARRGIDLGNATDDQIRQLLVMQGEMFRDQAPMTASQAVEVILEGVREKRWRILVGEDAHVLDRLVREDPESAYGEKFMERLQSLTKWGLGDLTMGSRA